MDTKGKFSPIGYRLKRNVSGAVFTETHEAVTRHLSGKGWHGSVEKRNSGIRLCAWHTKRKHFFGPIFLTTHDFLLATCKDIISRHMYKAGDEILFWVSDNEVIAPFGHIRWIEDANNPIFKKFRSIWWEYTNELDTILS